MITFNAKSMPKALVAGTPLPHEGHLAVEDIEHLKSLGYDVVDLRTTFGTRQVELLMQAFLLGTVPIDGRAKIVAEARKVWADVSKEEAEAALDSSDDAVDAVALLTGVATEAPKVVSRKRRRGRPPGVDR